jgi:hypothetical protein
LNLICSFLKVSFFSMQMVWADRAQTAVAQARRVKNWLLGRPGLILAVVMLLLAFVLHRLGYIGG